MSGDTLVLPSAVVAQLRGSSVPYGHQWRETPPTQKCDGETGVMCCGEAELLVQWVGPSFVIGTIPGWKGGWYIKVPGHEDDWATDLASMTAMRRVFCCPFCGERLGETR